MLDSMRRHANSWVFSLIFAVIIFVFAINFGPWAGRVGHDTSYAAEVNGRVISMTEFQSAYAMQLRLMQMYRPGYTPEQAEHDGLRSMVLDQLVSQELLAQLAESNDLTVTDKELVSVVKKRMTGDDDKDLDKDTYHRWVYANYQMTEGQYEARLKREILADRMVGALTTGVNVSDADVRKSFNAKNDQVSVDYIRINPKMFPAPNVPTDSELAAYVAAHEADLKSYYDKNIGQFRASKQVHARHILAKMNEKSSPAEKEAALKKITAAKKRVTEGKEDFAKVAKELSEDGSASAGGDLGFFGEGAMVPTFEAAAFKLADGQISDVVQTPFGYHIIKVEGTKPPVHKDYADAKMGIAKILWTNDRQMEEAKKYASEILTEMKAGKKLDKVSVKGLDKMAAFSSTSMFSPSAGFIPGLGVAPEVVAASFKLSAENHFAQEAILSNGNLYVIALKERKFPDDAQFAKDKDSLRASLTNQRTRQFMQSYLESLNKNAKIVRNQAILTPSTTENS